MSPTLPVSRIVRAAAVAAAGVAVVAASTAPAQAHGYTGTVTGENGVNVRTAPTVHGDATGTLPKGETVTLECKVRGTAVDGNDLWYAVHEGTEWVSARFVENAGPAPKWCPQSDTETATGTVSSDLNVRQGPTTADRRMDTLPAGSRVELRCSVASQPVGDDHTWYATTSGQWVTGAYLEIDGGVAECNLDDAP